MRTCNQHKTRLDTTRKFNCVPDFFASIRMMIHSVQKLFCLVACFIGGTFASRPSQSEILEGHKEVLPSAVSDVLNLHERHLQW